MPIKINHILAYMVYGLFLSVLYMGYYHFLISEIVEQDNSIFYSIIIAAIGTMAMIFILSIGLRLLAPLFIRLTPPEPFRLVTHLTMIEVSVVIGLQIYYVFWVNDTVLFDLSIKTLIGIGYIILLSYLSLMGIQQKWHIHLRERMTNRS